MMIVRLCQCPHPIPPMRCTAHDWSMKLISLALSWMVWVNILEQIYQIMPKKFCLYFLRIVSRPKNCFSGFNFVHFFIFPLFLWKRTKQKWKVYSIKLPTANMMVNSFYTSLQFWCICGHSSQDTHIVCLFYCYEVFEWFFSLTKTSKIYFPLF